MEHRTNKKFRDALERLNISQREFAALIETDYSAINRWALGKAKVPGSAQALLDLFEEIPELAGVLKRLRK